MPSTQNDSHVDQRSHAQQCLTILDEWRRLTPDADIVLDGHSLSIAQITAVSARRFRTIGTSAGTADLLRENAAFLDRQLTSGKTVYGVNTGYGGSADVRSDMLAEMQTSLMRMLNAGFGDAMDTTVMRAVMAVRANSLALGYSGVRPEVVDLLCKMVNADVVPVAPLRGSISASGDLIPTSYVAACMAGRPDAKVVVGGTRQLTAPEAFSEAGLKHVEFGPKEALAVANAASVGATLAAVNLFDSGLAILLTQVVTALVVEALKGRMEAFDETIHDICLPHRGNIEVAHNIRMLVQQSRLVRSYADCNKPEPDAGSGDGRAELKQDRYAIRTSAQWLGPAVETWTESVRRITVELNSANDNPLIDHRQEKILHCGNFQGIAITVAMDQVRQSLQMCGKLVFAQLSEVLNHHSGHGLPPNLSGCDVCTDFGFKGVDIATASYISELDHITPPLTNHVVSAEMHNQSVNSLALVSARTTATALKILQMILTNALCALCQAIDLRWLEMEVKARVAQIIERSGLRLPKHPQNGVVSASSASLWHLIPWYDAAFCPGRVARSILDLREPGTNGLNKDTFVREFVELMETTMAGLKSGRFTDDIARTIGAGTRQIYIYIRQKLDVSFQNGTEPIDKSLAAIYESIRNRNVVDVITSMFSDDRD